MEEHQERVMAEAKADLAERRNSPKGPALGHGRYGLGLLSILHGGH